MSALLAAVSPFFAWQQSDLFARGIILVLCCGSVVAWSIMVERWLLLRAAARHNQRLLEDYDRGAGLEALLARLADYRGPLQRICRQALEAVAAARGLSTEALRQEFCRRELRPELGPRACHRVRALVQGAVDREIVKLEMRLGLLSSVISASPFLGLLGTVWGVMMAFCAMAIEGRANINALAPGVSGALLTTVVGLLVAIPAVLGYNLLVNHIKMQTVVLDTFADDLLSALEERLAEPAGKE